MMRKNMVKNIIIIITIIIIISIIVLILFINDWQVSQGLDQIAQAAKCLNR